MFGDHVSTSRPRGAFWLAFSQLDKGYFWPACPFYTRAVYFEEGTVTHFNKTHPLSTVCNSRQACNVVSMKKCAILFVCEMVSGAVHAAMTCSDV